MKKILILAGIAIATTMSHAAAVSWNSGAVYKATDITAKVGKNATGYLVTISFFNDAFGESSVTDLTGTFSVNTAGTGSKYSGTVDGFDASKQYYTQLIITTDGYEAKSSIVAFTTPGTGDAMLNFTDGSGFNDSSFTFSTGTAGTWQQAVPEPTSGLLMLLGVAGLALRRKRV